MHADNQELIRLTSKMMYQLHIHEKYGSERSLKQAYAYKQKAEMLLNKIGEGSPSPLSNKLYINR
jgi:hypothetical protein